MHILNILFCNKCLPITNLTDNYRGPPCTQTHTHTLESGEEAKDIGFESHILFYCSNMAGQYIQHSTNNTPAQSDIHTDKWQTEKTNLHRRSHTYSSELSWLIETRISLGNHWSNILQSHTHTHTRSETDEQTNHTGQQDKLCIKGDFKEIKDPVTIKDQNVQSPP